MRNYPDGTAAFRDKLQLLQSPTTGRREFALVIDDDDYRYLYRYVFEWKDEGLIDRERTPGVDPDNPRLGIYYLSPRGQELARWMTT